MTRQSTQADRQADKQTNRQPDKQTNRQTDKQTQRKQFQQEPFKVTPCGGQTKQAGRQADRQTDKQTNKQTQRKQFQQAETDRSRQRHRMEQKGSPVHMDRRQRAEEDDNEPV